MNLLRNELRAVVALHDPRLAVKLHGLLENANHMRVDQLSPRTYQVDYRGETENLRGANSEQLVLLRAAVYDARGLAAPESNWSRCQNSLVQ